MGEPCPRAGGTASPTRRLLTALVVRGFESTLPGAHETTQALDRHFVPGRRESVRFGLLANPSLTGSNRLVVQRVTVRSPSWRLPCGPSPQIGGRRTTPTGQCAARATGVAQAAAAPRRSRCQGPPSAAEGDRRDDRAYRHVGRRALPPRREGFGGRLLSLRGACRGGRLGQGRPRCRRPTQSGGNERRPHHCIRRELRDVSFDSRICSGSCRRGRYD